MMQSWMLNTAWMLGCAREARAFSAATRRVETAQSRVLQEMLAANRETVFGRRHGFSRIGSARDFQQRVPLSRYEDYATLIARIGAGAPNVLTRDAVELLEPTSGTTGGEKLIPFTGTLRRQFQRAVGAWMANLLWRRPAIRKGRAYWSISPLAGPPRRTAGGVQIGFADDAAYLSTWEQWALGRLLVVPGQVARIADADTFRYVTLYQLLAASDLSLISIWSPTFLPALLAPLERWQEQLCADLARGSPSFGSPLPLPLPVPLTRNLHLRPRPRRAEFLRHLFRATMPLAERLRQIWPNLALISTWADAGAARYLPALRQLFPAVEIQPKGLLATEGCVSFPLVDAPASILAVRSHFLEFEPLDGMGPLRMAHELDRGGRYRVIITTGGGLYRYGLRDEIEVVAFQNQCPLVRFLGKSDCISDLVGEKLGEPHVRAAMDAVFLRHGIQTGYATLVPVEGCPPRYRLYLQGPATVPDALVTDFEAALQGNPHYAGAIRLGQLAPVEVGLLDPQGAKAWDVYERRCVLQGARCGNIKPVALDPRPGWPEAFAPLALPASAHASAHPPAPAAAQSL